MSNKNMPEKTLKNNKKDQPSQILRSKPSFCVRYFIVIIILTALVVGASGYFLLIRPAYNKYNQDKSLYQSNQAKAEAKKNDLRKLIDIRDDYRSIGETDKAKINDMLPNGPDESSLYVNIETIAEEIGITLESISLSPEEAETKKKLFAAEVAASGIKLKRIEITVDFGNVTYLNLKLLFASLEKNLRLFDVQNFQFSPEAGTASMTLSAYYL